MANQSNRREGRDRYGRDRRYGRQAEQFDATSQGWHNEERGYGQFGESWADDDYGQYDVSGQSYSRDRRDARSEANRRYGGAHGRGSYLSDDRFDTFTSNDYGGRDFTRPRSEIGSAASYGAGTRLASGHGEWHDSNERGWFDRASDEVASWFGDEEAARRREIYDHRGRGPEGYVRSDERILEDACDELTEDWGVDASKIQVSVSSGEVTLNGTVPSRQQKRRAEDCVDDLSGVRNVQNNLRVEQPAGWGSSQGGGTTAS